LFRNNALLGRLLAIIICNHTAVSIASGVGILLVTGQLFEGLSLGLGNAQCGEDTQEHEEGVDLHDVVLVWVRNGLGGTLGSELGDTGLADDGANLAHTSGEAVGGGTVAGREAFTGDNEGGCVGAYIALVNYISEEGDRCLTEVEEELHQDIDSEMSVWLEVLEIEPPNDEKNGKSNESHHLDWFTADGVNRSY
jgi:hypothetical protein